jgi:hypothetical protein
MLTKGAFLPEWRINAVKKRRHKSETIQRLLSPLAFAGVCIRCRKRRERRAQSAFNGTATQSKVTQPTVLNSLRDSPMLARVVTKTIQCSCFLKPSEG